MKYIISILSVFIAILMAVSTVWSATEADSAQILPGSGYRYFDKPIDPDLYLIRPGEKLTITFINARLPKLVLDVDPESRIIHPTLGVFDLTGKTLTQTREILWEKLVDLYKVNQIAISVGNPQKVGILISGAVRAPGLYTAYTSQRVSEIIDSANGITPDGSRRWIQFSGGPKQLTVDLDRAEYLGDYTADPCLYAGYVIYVPAKSDKRVQIIGEVNTPREIELIPNDSVRLLIQLAGGARSKADLNRVKLISGTTHQIADHSLLKADDIIIVPSIEKNDSSQHVIIFGAVNKPGYYIYTDGFILPDLIKKAGGFTKNANNIRAIIFRLEGVDQWGRLPTIRYPLMCVSGEKRNLESIVLQPGDSVYIPPAAGYVKVSGPVRNPGRYPFYSGKDAAYYINIAGGFLPSADNEKVYVYNRITGMTETYSPDAPVYDGDEIIIKPLEVIR